MKIFVMAMLLAFGLLLGACAEAPSPVTPPPAPPTGNVTENGQLAPIPEPEPVQMLTIGVLQIIAHPALDAAREGFISKMAELGFVEGVNVTYNLYNAQGDISNAHMMAARIVDEPSDLILGIATGTSQALANATDTIPIVITAVTAPDRAGLVEDLNRPNTNVTGTSDLTPVAQQMDLLVRLLPEAQTVGIVFNGGEVNSVIQAEMAMEAATARGLSYVIATVTGTADVAQVVESIVDRVDVIYTPTCNTMAATYSTVVRLAEDAGLPVIVGEEAGVDQGALATYGINYYELGRQTAIMAAQILHGEAIPQEMPIQYQEENSLVINTGTAARLGIEIPPEFLAAARIVE